jgi:ATP-dependent Clp protease ATP-binding subunit ClpC
VRPVNFGASASRGDRSESELVHLRKRAIELAAARKERATTVHLLAAIAGRPGPARDLLATRALEEESLLKAGRTFDETTNDPIERSLAEARSVSKRARGPVSTDDKRLGDISPDSRMTHLEPNALHLLVALLSERSFAAYRALSLTGVDTSRLRTAALALALGVVPTPRPTPESTAATRSIFRGAELMRGDANRRPSSPPPSSPRPSAPRTEGPRVVPFHEQPGLRAAPLPTSPARPSTPSTDERAPARTSRKRPVRPALAESQAVTADAPTPSATNTTAIPAEPVIPTATEPTASGLFLSLRAKRLEPEEVIGRDEEIERAVDVLSKREGNAVVLVGPVGVGKSSVVRGLVGPLARRGRPVYEVPLGAFLASAPRGALADKLGEIFEELAATAPTAVLVIDDLHDLLGAADDIVTELKARLAGGSVAFVSAMTAEHHRRMVEPDGQLSRRLVAVFVDEPEESDAFLMVRRSAAALGEHHGVQVGDAAIAASVSFTIRHLAGRALPEKALSILDLAAARARRGAPSGPVELGPEDVARAVAAEVDVPVERMLSSDAERLLGLEGRLGELVVGHDTAVRAIAAQLRKSAAGLGSRRPLGSFLLLGPTGVGKTETAKAVAEVLFGSSDAMTRIDLSEYGESHSVARLFGAPPGYVGHEAGGQLTEAVRRRAYQVVLLDELEKAHGDVLLAFLQVLDEGHLTDGRGRRVDFRNTVIFATSNLGSRDIAEAMSGRGVGFARSAPSPTGLEGRAVAAAKRALPLELFNRFDEILFYSPLSREEVLRVARRLLGDLAKMLRARDIGLEVDDAALLVLLERGGFDAELGARPMRRTLARLVEAPIAELLLRGQLGPGMVVLVGEEDGELSIDAVTKMDRSAAPPAVS